MDNSTSANELSPLDQIRFVEGEMARRLIVAREKAEQEAGRARVEAASLKRTAQEKGKQAGQIRYKEVIARAEEEAKVIRAQGEQRAGSLRWDARSRMDRSVDQALQILLGSMDEAGK